MFDNDLVSIVPIEQLTKLRVLELGGSNDLPAPAKELDNCAAHLTEIAQKCFVTIRGIRDGEPLELEVDRSQRILNLSNCGYEQQYHLIYFLFFCFFVFFLYIHIIND